MQRFPEWAASGAIISGSLINVKSIFGRLEKDELFDDGYFVNLPVTPEAAAAQPQKVRPETWDRGQEPMS